MKTNLYLKNQLTALYTNIVIMLNFKHDYKNLMIEDLGCVSESAFDAMKDAGINYEHKNLAELSVILKNSIQNIH